MDPEIKEMLEHSIALGEENNRLLKSLRRANRLALAWRILYIGIFLGGAAVAFNFLQPYYEGFRATYGTFVETQTQINDGIGGFFKK